MTSPAASPIADVADRAGDAARHGPAVRAMFGRIAPTYDRLNRLLSAGLDVSWRRRAVDALSGAPCGPRLDLCAGTLDLTVMLDRDCPGERVIACDFSEPMLQRGRARASRAEIVVADVQALPFEDRSIAAAVCGFGVRNVADPARALGEIRRVMVPGGVFVTLEFFRPTRLPTRLLHHSYARGVLPIVGGLISGDREAYAYLARSIDGFLSRAEYERAAERAGFVRVTGEDLTFGVASIVRAEVPR
jgi:ubiquinone/menaquinone biosynthesis methyltransferase